MSQYSLPPGETYFQQAPSKDFLKIHAAEGT